MTGTEARTMTSPVVGERFRALKPSITIETSERIRVARASGRKIIGLASGDPNLVTDERIIEAALKAMRGGATRYGSPAGESDLREAIVQRELSRSGVKYAADDVIVTPGGKFALLTALMGIVSPGDEVIVPHPGWVSYGPCVRLCGGTVVPLETMETFDHDALERLITPATRAIIVNSPVNPTGRVLSRADMDGIVAVANAHNLWIVFDQVYADFVFKAPMVYAQSIPGGFARTMVVDSFSKSFGMTGWRLGYLALPPGFAKSIVKFMQHSVYCVPPFVQQAGVRALELSAELLQQYRAMFRARVERGAAALRDLPWMTVTVPDAGFFLFPRVDGDAEAIARRWLDQFDVAVLPGSAFGPAGASHLRISLTCSDSDLDVAFERMARAGNAG